MKIFKSTNNDTTFIKQLLDVINPNTMRSIVKKYSGDYRSQSFDSYSHFFTMMYLQLNDSKTLRCCITELQNDIDIQLIYMCPAYLNYLEKIQLETIEYLKRISTTC